MNNMWKPIKRALTPDRSIWGVVLILGVFFTIQSQYFLTPYNISNLLTSATLIGFIALGLTPVIISSNIDLSVGSTVALTACLAVLLQPYGPIISIGGAVVVGIIVGLLNGIIVEKLGVDSFIATLATMIGIRGVTYLIVGNVSLNAQDMTYNIIATMLLIGPFSTVAVVFLFIAAILIFVLRKSVFGRNIYAIGGNRESAINVGIPTSRVVIYSFIMSGVLAAISGIALSARLMAAAPSYGTGYELIAIATVILGGTRLEGGYGFIVGTVGAIFALTILRNGLSLLGTSPFIFPVIIGLILIMALSIDQHIWRRLRAG